MSHDENRSAVALADADEPFIHLGALVVIAIVVLPALAMTVANLPRARAVPVAILGAAYFFVLTAGVAWSERRGRRALIVVLLGGLLLLAMALQWAAFLPSSLMVMPLISMFVLYTTLSWAVAATALIVAFGVFIGLHGGSRPINAITVAGGVVPAAAFVIAFSQLLLRERRARVEVRRYAAQVEELAVLDERNRIAREIHDSVGHYLTVVHVQIEAARALVPTDARRADECLARAQELSREGLSELRRSVTMLRSAAVEDRPFGVALSTLVEEARSQGLDTSLTVDGTPRALAPNLEFTLYRVAQEALTNVTRHSRAAHASCTLRYRDGDVVLQIEDDGVGAAGTEGGFGLTGVRERVQLVGGTMDVRTAVGKGFAIHVCVPA